MDVRGLSESLERRIKVISPIKDGIHNRVRWSVPLEVKRFYEEEKEVYKERYKIERTLEFP